MMRLTRASIVFLFLGAAILAQSQEYVISTFAGGAPPPTPVLGVNMAIGLVQGVAADAAGTTYFVASACVFKLDQNGVVTRIAGNARAGYSGDGGPATSAELQLQSMFGSTGLFVGGDALPPGVAIDNGGNVYVADNGNYRVRRISPNGIITTVAGNGTPGFSGDGGPATSAQLSPVFGLAVDAAGNLMIADSGGNRIRRVTPDGSIATVAGTGDCGLSGDDGPAVTAQICGPTGIAADTVGNLFITDSQNNRIRQISPDGTITTVAGTGPTGIDLHRGCAPSGDGGPATSATLCLPSNVAVDQAGNLFVADTYYPYDSWQVVRKISPSGITTVAGLKCEMAFFVTECSSLADGTTATKTFLGGALGLAVDSAGNLLIADRFGQRVRKVSSDGAIASVAGNSRKPFSGDGGPATSAQLASPEGVAVDGAGNVFIADYANARIERVTPDGIITTVAGNGTYGFSGDGGPATSAQLAPFSVAVDGAGNLYFFDIPNRSIRKVSPDGIITTVTTAGGNNYFVALDSAGDLFFVDPNGTPGAIVEVSPDGTRRVAGYGKPVAVDNAGDVFIACGGICKVTPDGVITNIVRNVSPVAGAVDRAGNLFIVEYPNRIRRVSPDGIITTIAGNGTDGYSGDGGPAIRASLSMPNSLAVDGAGNVYVADTGNNAIRILRPVPTHRPMPRD